MGLIKGTALDRAVLRNLSSWQLQYIKDHYKDQKVADIAVTILTSQTYVRRAIRSLNLKGAFIDVENLYPGEVFVSAAPIKLSRYEISNYGRIRRAKDHASIALVPNSHKDIMVRVTYDHKKRFSIKSIARLTAELLLPESKTINIGSHTITHIDGNKSNNHVSNLRWTTHAELGNRLGKYSCRGEESPVAIHTEDEVRMICKLYKEEKMYTRAIVERYPQFKFAWVNSVIYGVIWTHVTKEYGIKPYDRKKYKAYKRVYKDRKKDPSVL